MREPMSLEEEMNRTEHGDYQSKYWILLFSGPEPYSHWLSGLIWRGIYEDTLARRSLENTANMKMSVNDI